MIGPGPAQPLVSICVANYNYADYVGLAVDSALAQTYPHVEVVVVDDGSTDGSLSVLRGYGNRIRLVEQENSGHIAGVNRGFATCSGAVVLFLDADDLLAPHAVERVVDALAPGTAKVQFRLQIIDADGAAKGVFPHRLLELDEGDLRAQLCAEGDYVGPVTSGNAYVRTALEQVMPLAGGAFDTLSDGSGPDGYLNSMVPFFGRVVSIDEVLGSYRAHGANHSAASGSVPLRFMRWRVDHELRREAEIRRLAAAQSLPVARDLMCANPEHVLVRMLSLRLDPEHHPVSGDRRTGLIAALLRRSLRSRTTPPARRLLLVVVCVLCAVLPAGRLPALAGWTLASRPRPRVLRLLASVLRRPSRSRVLRGSAGRA